MWKKNVCMLIVSILLLAFSTACSTNSADPTEKNGEREIKYNINNNNIPFTERSVKNNVYLAKENVGGLKESAVRSKLEQLATRVNVDKRNATLNSSNWEIVRGKVGKKLNVQKTLDRLLGANEGEKISPIIEEEMPEVTSAQFVDKVTVLGSYTTPLLDTQVGRVNNIEIAAQKLDCKRLEPGEEFSFNNTIGKRTADKGYEQAPIIIRTEQGPKKGYGIGGGICQVATTLYNAVEESGLEVTERHEHSKDVPYVSEGKDAAVSYGAIDFKFINNRSHAIMIRAFMSGGELTMEILENKA